MPKKKPTQKVATIPEKVTDWMGTPQSIFLHTLIFGGAFLFVLLGVSADKVMLVLTTAVSLEAIYLSLFIQMSVNRQAKSIAEVEKDIDEIQEDVDEIQEDVESLDDISEDIDQLQVSEAEEEADIDKTHVSLLAIESHIYSVTENLTSLREELEALKNVMHQHKIDHPTPPPTNV